MPLRRLPRNELEALSLAIVVVLCWSTVATAFKLGLGYMSVAQLLFMSSSVSLIFFVLTFLIFRRAPIHARTLLYGSLLGFLNPFFYYLVLFEAYDLLPAQIAQPLNCSHAIVTALIAIPILKQRPTARMWTGIVVGYFGVVILVTRGSLVEFSFDVWGVGLALFSSIVWALYWVVSVRVSKDPIGLLLVGFAVATPCIGVYCVVFDDLPTLTATNIGFGLWVGLIEMGLAFLLWQRALALTQYVGTIAPMAYLSPAISLIFIHNVLGERVEPITVVGLLVLLLGIVILHFRRTELSTN